ncbi:MAG: lysine--tRNA ligase [Methanobacteriota archaeon]
MHWADVLAAEVAKQDVAKHVFATAITPSGPIHVGNMREVLTTEMVYRATRARGAHAELIYIADSFDPLRKVYPFLDKASYEPHVGKPLSEIPCPGPDGKPGHCHASYAHHFIDPFLEALSELGVDLTVMHAHEMYERGAYVEATKLAMANADVIRDIVLTVAKREGKIPENWIPFNVQCENCRRLNGPIPTLFEDPYIDYACKACGHEGRKDIRKPGGGKLPWRVDWPARWSFLGVTFEAMGKDHAAAGSSWDTGVEIVRRVYGREPPVRTVYEFIQLKGIGAMHSSTGTAVSAEEMLKMTPPEVLRFLIARPQPGKHIDFDPGEGVVGLVDEYDRWEHAFFAGEPETAERKELKRVYELSQPRTVPTKAPPEVPYTHLVNVVSAYPSDAAVFASLSRQGLLPKEASLDAESRLRLLHRVGHARYWLGRFAPEKYRNPVVWDAAEAARLRASLSEAQRAFLGELAERLAEVAPSAWTGEDLHNLVHEAVKGSGLPPRDGFAAIYRVILGKEKGPRAGDLLAQLPRETAVAHLSGIPAQI